MLTKMLVQLIAYAGFEAAEKMGNELSKTIADRKREILCKVPRHTKPVLLVLTEDEKAMQKKAGQIHRDAFSLVIEFDSAYVKRTG